MALNSKGSVKFFNEAKGFGFIVDEESGKDIFFHQKNTTSKVLKSDDKVTFVKKEGKKGLEAHDVALEK
jgi:CspA family cold shock protein